jgi:hypothetical protein
VPSSTSGSGCRSSSSAHRRAGRTRRLHSRPGHPPGVTGIPPRPGAWRPSKRRPASRSASTSKRPPDDARRACEFDPQGGGRTRSCRAMASEMWPDAPDAPVRPSSNTIASPSDKPPTRPRPTTNRVSPSPTGWSQRQSLRRPYTPPRSTLRSSRPRNPAGQCSGLLHCANFVTGAARQRFWSAQSLALRTRAASSSRAAERSWNGSPRASAAEAFEHGENQMRMCLVKP